MEDNKSHGHDLIPRRLLMETEKQIRIPLARVSNLSLKEGVVLVSKNKCWYESFGVVLQLKMIIKLLGWVD